LIYLVPFIGAIIARIHGAGLIPKVWISLIWAVPFAYAVGTYNLWLAIPALGLCALGKSTGHGQYFDLANMPHNGKTERLDFIVKFITSPLKYKISAYWYDVIGLSVVGLASVSGGLLVAWYNPVLALLIALGGLTKPIGYMIGWKLFKSPSSTETGEYISGFFAYLPLVYLWS